MVACSVTAAIGTTAALQRTAARSRRSGCGGGAGRVIFATWKWSGASFLKARSIPSVSMGGPVLGSVIEAHRRFTGFMAGVVAFLVLHLIEVRMWATWFGGKW